MEGELPEGFFKFMMPGYKKKVSIPKAFCQKLNGQHPEVAYITTCKGTWEVKIEKSSNNLISFGRGWSMFVREHDLDLEDLIIFIHCGNLHFTAVRYDHTACKKMFESTNLVNDRDGTTGRVSFCDSQKKDDHPTEGFFKIMMPGYKTKVALPKAFCQKLNGQHPKVANITTCKGTWEVKIEKSSNNLISFGRGWSMFVREHDLDMADLIVFEHCGNMHFTVVRYDLTACRKKFESTNLSNKRDETTGKVGFCDRRKKDDHPIEKTTKNSTSDSSHLITAITPRDDETTGVVGFCGRPKKEDHPREKPIETSASDSSHFITTITPYVIGTHFRNSYIPKAFSVAHGLSKKKRVILTDSTGVKWPVTLAHYCRKRIAMVKGWSDFCLAKNLKIGDTCTFTFRESPSRCDFVLMDVCISQLVAPA